MSDSMDQHRSEDETPIQIDAWGVKFRAASSAEEYQPPKTTRETITRVKEHLLALVVAPFALADSITQATIDTVRGVGGLLVRPEAAEHQQAADTEEDGRQAKLEETQQQALPAPEVAPSETPIAEKRKALEDLLNELRAKGIDVQISDLGPRGVGISLVRPEQTEMAQALIKHDFLPELEADLRLQPVSELGLSKRALRCVEELGIDTIGALTEQTAAELLAVDGCGPATVEEIRARLADFGFELWDD